MSASVCGEARIQLSIVLRMMVPSEVGHVLTWTGTGIVGIGHCSSAC